MDYDAVDFPVQVARQLHVALPQFQPWRITDFCFGGKTR